jgi:hypothetical protein
MEPGGNPSYICPNGSCFTFNSATRELSANVREDVDLLLMDAVPFELIGLSRVAETAQVSAVAAATRSTANISLVFDVSGSMGCPANEPNCNCKKTVAGCYTPGYEVKIDTLVKAVEVFVNYFDEGDNLQITPFSMVGYPIPAGPGDLTILKQVIQNTAIKDLVIRCILGGNSISYCAANFNTGTTPSSMTNLCDGLMDTYAQQKAAQTASGTRSIKYETAYVTFIDGAPTAATVLWAYPTSTLPVNIPPDKDLSGSIYGYLNFRTHWEPPPSSSVPEHDGPSLLIKPQSVHINWPVPLPPDPDAGRVSDPSKRGTHVPVCHQYPDAKYPSLKSEQYPPWKPEEYYKVFKGCLDHSPSSGSLPSLGFKLPDGTGIYAANLTGGSSTVAPDIDKIYYLCPLAMADVMRRHKGTFYVVGVGSPAAVANDSYQDPTQWFLRKDVFGAKLANDKAYSVEGRIALNQLPHPENWNPGSTGDVMSYSNWEAQDSPRFGHYFASPTMEQLHDVYRSVAKQIVMRLIQ